MYVGGAACLQHGFEATKIAGQYVKLGSEYAAHYIWVATCCGADFSYRGGKATAEYMVYGAQVGFESAKAASIIGSQYLVEGSKIGSEYIQKGSVYAYQHGSVALKEGSIKSYHYLIYFFTNFRVASAEAAVWIWETSQVVAAAVASGACTAGQVGFETTSDLLVKTYHGVVAFGGWTYSTSITTYDWIMWTADSIVFGVKYGGIEGYNIACSCASTSYHGITTAGISIYENGAAVCSFVYYWTLASAEFISVWTVYLVQTISSALYVGFSQFGLRWLYLLGNFLIDMFYLLGQILTKFFTDLTVYVSKFVYVTANHIYSVVYIVVAFAYHLLSAVAAVIRLFLGGVVYCITSLFEVIIMFLRETVFAYLYMLHKYNAYREILFLGFIGLLSLYCTGLMKDRRRLDETDDADESQDEEEEEEEEKAALEQMTEKVVKKENEIKTVGNKSVMPSHDDVESSDEDLPDFSTSQGKRSQSLDEEDFVPDQEVPHFMDS